MTPFQGLTVIAQPLYYQYNYVPTIPILSSPTPGPDLRLGRQGPLHSSTNAPKKAVRMRSPLWALLEDFLVLLFGLAIFLSPIALASTIAWVVYGLYTGQMSPDAAVVFIVWSTFYVSIIAQLSRLIPEGFPTLDLGMTVFLTAFGGRSPSSPSPRPGGPGSWRGRRGQRERKLIFPSVYSWRDLRSQALM